MLNQLRVDQFYSNKEKLSVHHDAHIKTFQAQKMGVKVVICDVRGRPVSDTLAPMSSYLPNTFHNM